MGKFCSCKFLIVLYVCSSLAFYAEADRLVFVQSIFRHGVRHPVYKKEADLIGQPTEIGKVGELTNEGRYMIYLLGKIFYDKYWMKLFGGTQYENIYDLTQVHIRSTSYNRTIQSANSFMIGLLQKLPTPTITKDDKIARLPAFANAQSYQLNTQASVISIYGQSQTHIQNMGLEMERGFNYVMPPNLKYDFLANPYDQGDFLNKDSSDNCPNQKKWEAESDNSPTGMILRSTPIIQQMIKKFEQISGEKLDFRHIFRYTDGFYCLNAMNRPSNEMFNDPEMARAALYFAWMNTILSKGYQKTHLKAGSTILLQKTLNNIKAAIEDKGPKMVIYSAHDTTIIVFTGVLKLMTLECVLDNFINKTDNSDTCASMPTFGSSVNLEVWQSEDKQYKIKILYNGGYRKIPICGDKQYCQLDEFAKWVESVTDQDPNTLCGIPLLQLPLNTPKKQIDLDEEGLSRQINKYKHVKIRNYENSHHRLLRNM